MQEDTPEPAPESADARRERLGKAVFKRLLVLTGLFLPWTLATLFAPLWWFLEDFSEFQLQLFLAALVGLGIWAVPVAFRWIPVRRAGVPAGLTLLAALVHLAFLWPIWFGRAPEAVEGRPTFTVMAVNVHTANRNFDHVLDRVRKEKPHVLFLLEVDTAWRDAMAPLGDQYPFRRYWVSDHDNFGIAGLCRVPGARGRLRNLSPKTSAATDTMHVVFPWGGRDIEAVGVHTTPPGSGRLARGNRAVCEALAAYVREAGRPCVLAGDFNHTPWSPTFRRLLRAADLSHGREGRGYLSTWPRGVPFLRLPIDHVLVTKDLAIVDFVRFPAGGSDHNPILARIAVAGD